MRTRRSRLFVLLLHLVGCQYHRRSGIVGVQPWPVVLEHLDLDRILDYEFEPIWLQDQDGQCLGPMATFGQCGDATLWFVARLRGKLRMGIFGVQEQGLDTSFALRVIDVEIDADQRPRRWYKRRRRHQPECLSLPADGGGLRLMSCTTKYSSRWAWQIGSDGVLRNHHQDIGNCLFRSGSKAVSGDCRRTEATHADKGTVPTKLSFVRFRTVPARESLLPQSSSHMVAQSLGSRESSFSTRRHSRSEGHRFADISLKNPRLDASVAKPEGHARSPFDTLHGASPGLLASSRVETQIRQPGRLKTMPIQIHPYIQMAKDEVWTDPETGLEFRTDLCRFLGHTRKENGRHTLMGVGQYKKFVVKVYGVGYYVSKRDVLMASEIFEPYASMSADELRDTPEFYDILRRMEPGDNGFDRTIMIKTNMQLASDTIRSSLHADWTMLTDDAKTLLIGTSLQPRDADDAMLAIIQSTGNPSRCSCSQIAPEEYQSDPSCCARGTELSFTWTKNGTLEVRLNGRVMETFDRPDIAEGIFYEYLRLDDPMSASLIEHVVDGFPFVLGPLAQVRGLHMGGSDGHRANGPKHQHILKALGSTFEAVVVSPIFGLAANVQKISVEATENSIHILETGMDGVQHFFGEMDRKREWILSQLAHVNVKDLFEKVPEAMARVITQDKAATIQAVSNWVKTNISEDEGDNKLEKGEGHQTLADDGSGHPLSRWFHEVDYAPDEIGPLIVQSSHDLTRKLFLTLVHLYLLLLFIVSFPGSYSTRTKCVIRRSKMVLCDTDSNSDSEEVSDTEYQECEDEDLGRQMSKGSVSLSWDAESLDCCLSEE